MDCHLQECVVSGGTPGVALHRLYTPVAESGLHSPLLPAAGQSMFQILPSLIWKLRLCNGQTIKVENFHHSLPLVKRDDFVFSYCRLMINYKLTGNQQMHLGTGEETALL